ncbi:hypothetical protein GGI15_004344 [Coemansia interrupta]|uniref:Peptide hydrolase n=1 Tax=Coemansia interrupta TaxID=1126814 RepID=A0A9W8H7P7_9FUNG|nr:hypothetical protein GGI15_004344 [Coemansia interrupta]
MSTPADNTPLLHSTSDEARDDGPWASETPGIAAWWGSRSRDAVSLFTILLLLGVGLGIWVYGTLPTSDQDEHPHEYALHTQNILTHLDHLLDIARAHNNSRSVTNGHAASAQYVIGKLREHKVDCDVHVQRFVSPVWTQDAEPRFELRGAVGVEFLHATDFRVMRYGGSEPASLRDVGLATVEDACTAEAHDKVAGRVAVVRPSGKCPLFEQAFLMEQMGARAVVFVRSARYRVPSNARVRLVDWKEGDPLMSVPVLSVTHSVGQVLRSTAEGGRVSIETHGRIELAQTFNVVCVGRQGAEGDTVVVGAHLDSVAGGPGINDNGSGAMSALEILLTLTRIGYRPRNRLVFAWWGAEEDGLLGSRHFARVLAHGWRNRWSDAERLGLRWHDIALNLNFDMLASPNYIALVHNGTDAPRDARAGSQRIQRVFEDYFVRHDYPYKVTDMLAGSDFLPFVDNGVPAGGVLTGAGEIKSIEDRIEHGGLADAPLDTCYHRDCDTVLNINLVALHKMSKAAMYAVSTLSAATDLRDFLAGKTELRL